MLKKSFAIFALSVFFLAHFGRMINYLYCNLQTYVQTASFACDCEKQLLAGLVHDNNTHQEQSPKNIATPAQDEACYYLPVHEITSFHTIVLSKIWPAANNQSLYQQFSFSIFRPPLQISA
ncbi:MAG: hypothetical protein QM726_17220 [Chitinophagaceae bacterium]